MSAHLPPWRPPERETDAVEAAIVDAARRAVLPVAAIPGPRPDGDGVVRTLLPGGRHLAIAVVAQPVGAGQERGRAVLTVAIAGHARIAAAGRPDVVLLIEGRATLDQTTRAFLDLALTIDGA